MRDEPYTFEHTPSGGVFRIPPKSARRSAQFGAAWVGLLGGTVGAIAVGFAATLAGAADTAAIVAAVVAGEFAFWVAFALAHTRLSRRAEAALVMALDGSVSLGDRELIAAGAVVRVSVQAGTAGEDTSGLAVSVELRGGGSCLLPVPGAGKWHFNRGFVDRDVAGRFAAQVAESLAVPVAPEK